MNIAAIKPNVPRGITCMLAMICFVIPAALSLAQIPEFSGRKVPTLAPLVREITPSVVNISVQGQVKEDNPLYRDPRIREFFDVPEHLERNIQAVGSGVIVDAQRGYVLTANHVVAQVSSVQVTTKDGTQLRGQAHGARPRHGSGRPPRASSSAPQGPPNGR